MFAQHFKLGDGREVTWGRATLEEHLTRIAMLVKKRDGLEETIQRHRAAVAILESTGAKCLEELPAEQAA